MPSEFRHCGHPLRQNRSSSSHLCAKQSFPAKPIAQNLFGSHRTALSTESVIMPLIRLPSPAIVHLNGDIEFKMVAPDGVQVHCIADRDFVIAIAPDDRSRTTSDIFEEMHARIELEASDQYDLHGDQEGIVRLAPIAF
jgi:hypothetical protein